jgi:hypothetical protein
MPEVLKWQKKLANHGVTKAFVQEGQKHLADLETGSPESEAAKACTTFPCPWRGKGDAASDQRRRRGAGDGDRLGASGTPQVAALTGFPRVPSTGKGRGREQKKPHPTRSPPTSLFAVGARDLTRPARQPARCPNGRLRDFARLDDAAEDQSEAKNASSPAPSTQRTGRRVSRATRSGVRRFRTIATAHASNSATAKAGGSAALAYSSAVAVGSLGGGSHA